MRELDDLLAELKAEQVVSNKWWFEHGRKVGMARAAEIAETDTFAPPYGKRIADAIRAEITPSRPSSTG